MKKVFIKFSYLIFHLLAVSTIIYFFLPIAKWYLSFKPIWGIDFFLSTSLVSMLKEHFALPQAFWSYNWFGGWPIYIYPPLNTYLVSFFTHFYDLIQSLQVYMMVSTLMFALGGYFLFYVISRNFILSVALAIATALSGGVYQTLTWGGSLPSYGTQMFFPWALGFLMMYIRSGKYRYLLASALVAGLSILGHVLIFIVYILPATTLILFTDMSDGLKILKKIKSWFIYLVIVFIIGIPQFYSTIATVFTHAVQPQYAQSALSTTRAPTETELNIAKFNQAQVKRIITDNHILPFEMAWIAAILFGLSFLIGRKIKSLIEVVPFVLLAGYFAFYIWLFGQGVSIYHGGWYRLFWSVPIWMGALVAALWYSSSLNIKHFFKNRYLGLLALVAANIYIGYAVIMLVLTYPYDQTIKSIIYRSQASSAYPDIVNLKTTDKERQALKKQLTPAWLNGDDTNWRLYDGDQTVNIWWASLYKMPLSRGYLDPPLDAFQRGYSFWLDAALSESEGAQPQLVKSFKYPLDTTISNALFLIDWNGIRYFEGGHTGSSFTPVPTYLKQLLVNREEVIDLNAQKYTHRPVTLNYTEFKDGISSPIFSGTNAATIGVFGSDQGYETIVRAIAEKDNLNSQIIIPIKLGRDVDHYNLSDLKKFDSLYLYDYTYKNSGKTFKLLSNYAESGRKIFIETGVETKQSVGQLPDIFPVAKVERKGLGDSWQLENPDKQFTDGIDFSKFAPPIFDTAEWRMSYAEPEDIRDGVKVLLKNKGKVVMASQKVGNGEIIWSGLNFAYHVLRNHNSEEAKLFKNILSAMVSLDKKPLPKSNPVFVNANTRTIETEGARAILFKEQAYSGWTANLVKSDAANLGRLKIYKAGPAYPGYIYIPLPTGVNKAKVKLSFGGSWSDKIIVLVSFITVVGLFDEAFLHGMFLGRLRRKIYAIASKKVGTWWAKEDEE